MKRKKKEKADEKSHGHDNLGGSGCFLLSQVDLQSTAGTWQYTPSIRS